MYNIEKIYNEVTQKRFSNTYVIFNKQLTKKELFEGILKSSFCYKAET